MKTEKTYNADEPIVEQETYKLPAGVVFGLSTARGELVKLHGAQILEGKAPLMDKKTQNELCRLVGDFVNDLYKLKRENELLKEQRQARYEELEHLRIHVNKVTAQMKEDTKERL
jgi:hypothetical protein